MFIEKISIKSKIAYFKKVIDQLNANQNSNDNEFLRPVEYSDRALEIMTEVGAPEKIADLMKKNIFFSVYENYSQHHSGSLYTNQFAMIVAFDDTTVKTIKAPTGRRLAGKSYCDVLSNDDYQLMDVTRAFDFIDKHQAELTKHNPLATNVTYINEFMVPNLRAIDQAQGTHLVADYQAALANKFEKKKHLVLQNLQKQQDALFGNELKLP